jgi:hypothetical protein
MGQGTLSGYPEAITVTPFQVIKVRLQTKELLGTQHTAWPSPHLPRFSSL